MLLSTAIGNDPSMSKLCLLICMTTLLYFSYPVSSTESGFCAGTGYSHTKGLTQRGMQSMGATTWYSIPLNSLWAMNRNDFLVDPSVPRGDRPQMKITAVKVKAADGTEKDANGWLLMTLMRADSKNFKGLAVWVLTDKKETFGEFVFLSDKLCGRYNWLARESLMPCSATPINSPENPGMIIFADESGGGLTDVSLLWKADMSYCNKPESFFVMIAYTGSRWDGNPPSIIGLTPSSHQNKHEFAPLVYQSNSLSPNFYGPASGVDEATIVCNPANWLVNYLPVWLKHRLRPQLYSEDLGKADPKYYTVRWKTGLSITGMPPEIPGAILGRAVCKAQESGYVNFGGRCTGFAEGAPGRVWATTKTVPVCKGYFDAGERAIFTKEYYNFVDTKRKNDVMKGCDCPTALPTSTDIQSVRSLDYAPARPYEAEALGCQHVDLSGNRYDILGLCKNSVAGRSSEHIRMWHATTILFCVMFLIPASCFTARFLKGRMRNPAADRPVNEHLIPVKSWYLVHVLLVMPMVCMYFTSFGAMRRQYWILGKSQSKFAIIHRELGRYIMYLFAFQCVNGFLRPINKKLRHFAILLHWFCGYVVYAGGAAMCVISYLIPASPFSFQSHLNPGRFKDILRHSGPTIFLAWVVFDVLYHIHTQIYVIRHDRVLGLDTTICQYFPIILPIPLDNCTLEMHSELEKETRSMNRIFYVYMFLCLCSFFAVSGFMWYMNDYGSQGYGWMQCTHNDKGIFVFGSRNATDEDVQQRRRFCKDY